MSLIFGFINDTRYFVEGGVLLDALCWEVVIEGHLWPQLRLFPSLESCQSVMLVITCLDLLSLPLQLGKHLRDNCYVGQHLDTLLVHWQDRDLTRQRFLFMPRLGILWIYILHWHPSLALCMVEVHACVQHSLTQIWSKTHKHSGDNLPRFVYLGGQIKKIAILVTETCLPFWPQGWEIPRERDAFQVQILSGYSKQVLGSILWRVSRDFPIAFSQRSGMSSFFWPSGT